MNLSKKHTNKKISKIFISIILAVGLVVGITINITIGVVIVIFAIVINAIMGISKDFSAEEEKLNLKMKEEIAPKMINNILNGAEYLPYENISEDEYKQAEYMDEYDIYSSDDKIVLKEIDEEGQQYNIEFAIIHLKKDREVNDRFEGMFGLMKLPKDMRSKIKINREGTYNHDNIFKANVDNVEFEKVFDVMALNKKLINNILTNEIMSQMLNIYNVYGYDIDINIIRNMLYVRIRSGRVIKDTDAGKVIDRLIMEKRYNVIRATSDLMKNMAKVIRNLEL